jgi:NADP-dependent 3-hydroxy acid dehydrogenase YdfG
MNSPKTALVTGASSGIGAATVAALTAEGIRVIATARRADRLRAMAESDSLVLPFAADLTIATDVEKLSSYAAEHDVSIVIHAAGGAFDAHSIETSSPEIWRKTYEVNVISGVRLIQAMLPSLKKLSAAHILLVTSTAGHTAYENGGSYVAAKFAEKSLANTLRLELNGLPIRVTEIAPGMVKTDEFALNRFDGDIKKAAAVYEGVDAPLTAEDVAEAIRWSVTLPDHFNVDSLVIRPTAQAANHKVHRTTR